MQKSCRLPCGKLDEVRDSLGMHVQEMAGMAVTMARMRRAEILGRQSRMQGSIQAWQALKALEMIEAQVM